jgi:hypothetical protein
MSVAETIFLCPGARDLRILGVPGKLLVEEKMGAVLRSKTVHYPPTDWSGHRLPDDPDVVCQRIGQGAFNVDRACRLSAWWQAARPFRNKR